MSAAGEAARPAHSAGALLTASLLRRASLEVTARQPVDGLSLLPPGADVAQTHLPSDSVADLIAGAARLARAGFNPMPHVAARSVASAAALDTLLAGFSESGVRRVLLVAGDLATPRGPYADALSLLRGGAFARHGIASVGFAGHPEGSPVASEAAMMTALAAKLAASREMGLVPFIVTQFCFEAEPVLRFLGRLPAEAAGCAIRIGIAGPASAGMLLTFALRCGIGASMRALQKGGVGKIAPLLNEGRPEGLMAQIGAALAERAASPGSAASTQVEGFHLFSFGGFARTAAWRADLLERMA